MYVFLFWIGISFRNRSYAFRVPIHLIERDIMCNEVGKGGGLFKTFQSLKHIALFKNVLLWVFFISN